MTFHLTEQDWLAAEAALKGKPSGTKYEKYPRDPVTGQKVKIAKIVSHSFVIIDNVVYALANSAEDPPEEGGAAVVKKGLTKEGKLVAIKIKSAALEDVQSDAMQASIKNKLFMGQGVRIAPDMTIKLKLAGKIIQTNQKLYTVMEWRGDSLISQIEKTTTQLTNAQKWLLGLRACLLVEKLHRERIIHGDLKAENITARIQGNDIELNIIDFECAKELNEGEIAYTAKLAKGSPGFASPEILIDKRYSYLSDTYALATMLLFQIDVSCQNICYTYYNQFIADVIKNYRQGIVIDTMDWLAPHMSENLMDEKLGMIFRKMLHQDVNQREGSQSIIGFLCDKLLTEPLLEDELKSEILEIKSQHVASLIETTIPATITISAATSTAETTLTMAFSSNVRDDSVAKKPKKRSKVDHAAGHEPKIYP